MPGPEDWWRGAVVYQIYPRSFMDGNGDGIGDLQGIIEKLDYLNDGTPESLGVDAIWISPIYPSPMFDFGHDISDYESIDPVFGDLELFERLLEEAHARGIRIIMDLVINHTSHRHPWFEESRASRQSDKRDWYIWRDPKNGKEPNNWLAFFGGNAWEYDEATGQFYYHAFLPEQPDLNWRNPEVEKAVFDMVRFWLDLGVDGFRLDVVNLYFKSEQLTDNPTRYLHVGRAFDRQLHLHDRNQPEMHPLLKRFRQLVDSYPGRTSVGEVTLQRGEDGAVPARFQGDDDELHLTFNFAFFFSSWSTERFRSVIQHWEEMLQGDSWPTYTLSNHDYERHISRFATRSEHETIARAKVAAVMLLTLRGTPFLYYGEEIGMREQRVPRKRIVDPVGIRYWPLHPGRDGCRIPMAWTAGDHGGFSTADPWLPEYARRQQENVETARADSDSLFTLYRKLIWLRKATPALVDGEMELIEDSPPGVLAYRRRLGPVSILVALNFERHTVRMPLDPRDRGRVIFRIVSGTETQEVLELGPHQALLVQAGGGSEG